MHPDPTRILPRLGAALRGCPERVRALYLEVRGVADAWLAGHPPSGVNQLPPELPFVVFMALALHACAFTGTRATLNQLARATRAEPLSGDNLLVVQPSVARMLQHVPCAATLLLLLLQAHLCLDPAADPTQFDVDPRKPDEQRVARREEELAQAVLALAAAEQAAADAEAAAAAAPASPRRSSRAAPSRAALAASARADADRARAGLPVAQFELAVARRDLEDNKPVLFYHVLAAAPLAPLTLGPPHPEARVLLALNGTRELQDRLDAYRALPQCRDGQARGLAWPPARDEPSRCGPAGIRALLQQGSMRYPAPPPADRELLRLSGTSGREPVQVFVKRPWAPRPPSRAAAAAEPAAPPAAAGGALSEAVRDGLRVLHHLFEGVSQPPGVFGELPTTFAQALRVPLLGPGSRAYDPLAFKAQLQPPGDAAAAAP
jgi:hypothetical protein